MMEPSKADSFRQGAGAGGDGGGAPVAQAMEEARVLPQQPSATGSNLGAAPSGGAAPADGAATTTTTTMGAGGAALVPPGPGDGSYQPPTGQWKDHMFNCFAQTSPSCLVSCFLPCVALAMLSKRMGYASYNVIFWGLVVLAIFTMMGFAAPFYAAAVLVITVHILLIVRAKFDLPALIGAKKDGCLAITADVLAVCFCTPCVISQMLRHTFNYTQQCDECNIGETRIATLV